MFLKVIVFAALVGIAVASLDHQYHAPQPYKFGYEVKDKHGEQYRKEEGDGSGAVRGSYGFTDERGIRRHVEYVADHHGFRAQVKTNEPGTANQNPASVLMISDAPYSLGVGLGNVHGGLGFSSGLSYSGYNNGGSYGASGSGMGYSGGMNYERLGHSLEGMKHIGHDHGIDKFEGMKHIGYGLGNMKQSGYGGYGVGSLGGFGYGGYGLGSGKLGEMGYKGYGYGVGNLGGYGFGVGKLEGMKYNGYNRGIGELEHGRYDLRSGGMNGLGYYKNRY